MATLSHCAYCFETLSARLEKRQPLHLAQVEERWAQYEASMDIDEDDEMDIASQTEAQPANNPFVLSTKPAAISRLLSPNNSSASASSSSIPSTSSSETPDRSSATSKTSSSRSSIFSVPQLLGRRTKQSSTLDDCPLFVTWNTIGSDGVKSLRGCIGTFEAQKLNDGLREYALISAFHDNRFQPIPYSELPSLECGITLLTDFENGSGAMDWELGKHGIRISFTWHGRKYGATYLPDVAKEQGWTKEETIISLMKKAGWTGRRAEWKNVNDFQLVRYQGSKSTLDYATWRDWRDWTREQEEAH